MRRLLFAAIIFISVPCVADEAPVVAAAKNKIKSILADAEKARFEHVVVRVDGEGREYVCGRVDRPNREGYYANQRYFVVKGDLPRLMPQDLWQEAWQQECGDLPEGVKPLTPEELQAERLKRMSIAPSLVVEE